MLCWFSQWRSRLIKIRQWGDGAIAAIVLAFLAGGIICAYFPARTVFPAPSALLLDVFPVLLDFGCLANGAASDSSESDDEGGWHHCCNCLCILGGRDHLRLLSRSRGVLRIINLALGCHPCAARLWLFSQRLSIGLIRIR